MSSSDEYPDTIQMPLDESERLEALDTYDLLGPQPEEAFDRITALASRTFDVPIAMLNVIDDETQWTKSCVGLDVTSIDRGRAFCSHTVVKGDVVVVPDLREDTRFSQSAYVTGDPHLRFYAGAPLTTPEGHHLGTLCILDYEPRDVLSERERAILLDLAALALDELELRRETRLRQEEVEHRQAVAEDLRKNTERLETALNAASMGVWEWDMQTDTVHILSTLPPHYGFDAGETEMPLDRLLSLVADGFREEVADEFERARDDGEIPARRFRIEVPSGDPTWVEISGRRRSPDASIFIGAVRDVSLEQERLEQVRESKANFQRVLDNLPFGICALDNTMLVYANDSASELLGISRDDLPYPAEALIHPDSSEQIKRRLEKVRDNPLGEALEVLENRVVRADGEQIYVKSTAFGALMHGREVVISVMRDITEEKQLLARMMQMDRVAAIGTLSAGVGHEINNPLSYIRGNLDYAIRWLEKQFEASDDAPSNAPPPDGYEDVIDAMREAREGTQRIREITRDLRRLAMRPDQEFETYATNVNAVMKSATKLAHHELRRSARLEADYEMVPDAVAEPAALGQAFLNILLNAATAFDSATDGRDNVVRVSTSETEDYVVAEIEDNGRGIPEDRLDSVFDAFYTTRSTGEGTGLGLTTAQSSVEKMGGFIELESTEGEGTLVRICLPKSPDHPTIETPRTDLG